MPLRPAPADWRRRRIEQRPRRLVLFAVDASDSMGEGPELRMTAALGAVQALAGQAYLNRDLVGLIIFRDRAATVAVPPTGSVRRLRDRLRHLVVGGATPLADALRLAGETIRQARSRDPGLEVLLVLVSDGAATVPLRRGGDPSDDCLGIARQLGRERVDSLLVDTSLARESGNLLQRLADVLGGERRRLQTLTPNEMLRLLEQPAPRRQP